MLYQQLNPAEIRLLSFPPSTSEHSSKNETVSCTLETFSFAEDPEPVLYTDPNNDIDSWCSLWDGDEATRVQTSTTPARPNDRFTWGGYVALSYQWGASEQTSEILVNGDRAAVRTNLATALKVLRDKPAIRNGTKLWVDALCINQDDKDERSEQLILMRNIYRKASEVVVWLGDESGDTDTAFTLLYQLSSIWRGGGRAAVRELLRDKGNFVPRAWLGVAELFERAYWTRVWIRQEISMGKDSTAILCGKRAVPWSILYCAVWHSIYHDVDLVAGLVGAEYLEFRGRPFVEGDLLNRSLLYHLDIEQALVAGRLSKLSTRNQENELNTKGWHLMPILDHVRRAEATDERDKVYGILALLPQQIANLVVRDYALSIAQVYTSFAKAMILGSGNLEVLTQCTARGELAKPSWVPDWTYQDYSRLFTGANNPYKAGSAKEPVVAFRAHDAVLFAEGLRVATISSVGSGAGKLSDETSGVIDSEFATVPSEEFATDLWKTLTGNITRTGRPAPETFSCLLDISLLQTNSADSNVREQYYRDFIHANASLELLGKPLHRYFQPNTHSQANVDALQAALEQTWRFTRFRQLAATRERHVCMVPLHTKLGDLVCVLFGCSVPILLRRRPSGGFKLVGPCYCSGIMGGEALRDGRDGDSETFRIH